MKREAFNSRKGNKKISLLLVLKALELGSSRENPIRQTTLARMVNDYGAALNADVWCDRKTVGRHIEQLRKAGYPVVTVKGEGYYMESDRFTMEEYEALVAAIQSAPLDEARKTRLLRKLRNQQGFLK